MTDPSGPPPEVAEPAPRRTPVDGNRDLFRVSIRMKMLTSFAGAFTVVFVFLAFWIYTYSTDRAQERLQTQLTEAAVGGAEVIDPVDFHELVSTVPAVVGPMLADGTGAGYPDSPLYSELARNLWAISTTIKQANPYTYFKDPQDGRLYFAASAGYWTTPQKGVTYRVPVAAIVRPETYVRMDEGLTKTTNEPVYRDDYGDWISTYSPILDKDGHSVGAIGVDYPLDYIAQVQSDVRVTIIPTLIASYIILLALVMFLATLISRPIKRLTLATERIAEGEYDLDARTIVKTYFPDELTRLADSVTIMARKVGERERSLVREVQRLKVEIDHAKREEAVKAIVETEEFSDIISKAAEMRKRMKDGGSES